MLGLDDGVTDSMDAHIDLSGQRLWHIQQSRPWTSHLATPLTFSAVRYAPKPSTREQQHLGRDQSS